jgi:putative PIN family toxin of toxin-antitoxin system
VIRAVADTNVYISALNFGGTPERFLKAAQAGGFQLVISDAIIEEIGKVLRGDKFRWPEEEIAKAQRQIARFTERVQPTETLHVITSDPPDNRILECAAAAQADYIVSGDNHLLRLKQYGKAPVVKVADFMRRMQEQGSPQR